MRELNPSIELQELLARQIFNVLQGPVTEIVRQQCEGIGLDVNFRSVMEGNSLKVSETLLPQFRVDCAIRETGDKCSIKVEKKEDFLWKFQYFFYSRAGVRVVLG